MRKVIYGLSGLMGSAAIYLTLSAGIPLSEQAVVSNVETVYPKTSLQSVDGFETTLFEYDTYQLTDVDYSNFEKKETIKYSKANPMFYYIPTGGSASSVESAESSSDSTSEPSPSEPSTGETSTSETSNVGSSKYISLQDVLNKTYADKESKKVDLNNTQGYNVEEGTLKDIDVATAVSDFKKNGGLPLSPEFFELTSEFGVREDPFTKEPAFHSGEDYSAEGISKSNVLSVAPGIVEEILESNAGYGNYVIVNHGSYSTLYAHLSDFGGFEEGDEVTKGSVIGKVGSTGRSTGPHLHFEFRIGDVSVDPYLFFEKLREGKE